MTFKLTYPAELDLSYFQPHVTYTCMSHVVTALTTLVGQEVLDSQSRRALSSGTFTRPALRARGG